ncbi:T9SS type A sorting domain-containing protein [Hymenobacter terrenus]|uniref:T9SS type A sorting domain-containing protein n=1 Tax=Hymenobacter terrenus TaxID=1629124 RepID=UPI00373FE3EE
MVRLTDINGREVARQSATGGFIELNKNSHLKAGVYLLRVSDCQTTINRKLVVQ